MPPKLLGAPYTPPRVRRGDRVTCLYRDGDAIVSGWTDARIIWPRCRAVGGGAGSGLLMTEELRRAVLTESAAALKYWFGVGTKAVWNWRRWAGVGGIATTPGSRAAHRVACMAGGAAMKAKVWTDEERDARAEQSRQLALRPTGRWGAKGWKRREEKRLGRAPDETIALDLGRSTNAVRVKRTRMGIPAFRDRRM